jgi:hypothetical protein
MTAQPLLLPCCLPHYNRATRRASGRDRTVRRRRGRSRSEDAPVSGGCCGRRAGLPSAARGPVRGVGAHPSPDLYDLGVDRRDPVVAGHRDAVVSVPNEVVAADLVEAHGGQLLPPLVRAVYAAPPLAHALLAGQKGRVEVPVPADAPRYLLDLDRTYAAVGLPAPCQDALRLVERDRTAAIGVLPQPVSQAPQGRLQQGAMKILVGLLFRANVPDQATRPKG